MTRLIPVSDPPPPDDHHVWAAPAQDDCPDCGCCTARLCQTARDRDLSCCAVSSMGPGWMDTSECPCAPVPGRAS